MRLLKDRKIEAVVSKDESRPHLHSPYLDVENKRLVATNGHVLVALQVGGIEGDAAGYVPVDALRAARKDIKKDQELAIAVDERFCKLPNGAQYPSFDGQFPSWQKVVPTAEDLESDYTFRVGINARYIHEVAQALGTDNVILEFDPHDVLKLIVVRGANQQDDDGSIAAIMPIRDPRSAAVPTTQAAAKSKSDE